MTVNIVKPNMLCLEYRQEKEDKDYGSCLWARFTFNLDRYELTITSDCGNYGYKWVETPKSESFLELMARCDEGYILDKIYGKEIEMKWHPSLHMPKDAARIFLRVTNVRVERLQEITEDEAVKEGIYQSNCKECNAPFGCDACPDEGYNEIDGFADLWNSTIKKSDLDRYGWDANPWVWVIEFERCDKPESEEN